MTRILIVDDSQMARLFVKRNLEIIGLEGVCFEEAADGQEALRFLEQESVDLVITDLSMPVMDGATFLKKVRATPGLEDLPVVVISSAMNPARVKELIELGAVGVIAKPFTAEQLNDLLRPVLRDKGLLHE